MHMIVRDVELYAIQVNICYRNDFYIVNSIECMNVEYCDELNYDYMYMGKEK